MITYSQGGAVRVVGGLMVQIDVGFTDEEIKTLGDEALRELFKVRHHNALQEAIPQLKKELANDAG